MFSLRDLSSRLEPAAPRRLLLASGALLLALAVAAALVRSGVLGAAGGGEGATGARQTPDAGVGTRDVLRGGTWQEEARIAGLPDSVAASDFVGAETCAECHREQYGAWAESTHGNAGGRPGPETVIAPFDGTPIRFRDATVYPRVTPEGEYVFDVEWEGHLSRRLTVDGVVGRGHMVGGGTQGFFTREADGTYRFLPFDFSRTEGRWFCNTVGRRDRGWVFTEDASLADCTDWTPSRALGTIPRLNNCQGCHGSQIRVTVRRGAPHFDTEFTTLRVNCESCHGPGRRHVELARSGRIPREAGDGEGAAIGLPGPRLLSTDASLQVCFRCHAVKTPLREGYLPGKPFREHFAVNLPILGENPYLADGRIRTFAYQGTHLSSDCYLSGDMTCVDCHEPHAQGYRDHVGRLLEGRFDDGQCTSCHAAKAERPGAHTHHPPGTEGSRCVACHMPYLQEPLLGRQVTYARSDHTIPVPRPAHDAPLPVEGACVKCHTDRSPEEMQEAAEGWWGDLKPLEPLVVALQEARDGTLVEGGAAGEEGAGAGDETARLRTLARRLLRPSDHNPVAQFAALSWLLRRHLRPQMERVPEELRQRLRALARAPDREVAALALASLHYALGQEPEVQRFLTARAAEFGGRQEEMAGRWAVILGFLGDEHRDAEEIPEAIQTYRKALELRPDDPAIHFAMARAYGWGGNTEAAVREYRRTLELDPTRSLAKVNLGIVHAAEGREGEAIRTYRDAAELNPHEPLAWFNLANLHLRAGRGAAAVEAYRRTLELDGSLAPAWFNLTRALIRERRYREALRAVEIGLAFDPADETGRQMRRDLRAALEK